MYSSTITEKEILEYIKAMLNELYSRDQFLLDNNVTERSITHRMGMYLQQLLSNLFDVDCEYNRMGKQDTDGLYLTDGDYFAKTVCLSGEKVSDESDVGSRVYPDIIVHKRGTAENIMIIEVKITGKFGDIKHDYDKLKAYKEDLNYKFAYFIQLHKNKELVIVQKLDNSLNFKNVAPFSAPYLK